MANTRKKPTKTCEQCGAVFAYFSSPTPPRFCTRACWTVWRQAHPKRVTLTCEECGERFEREPWEVKRGRRRFCSVACSRPYINSVQRGKRREPQSAALIAKRLVTIAERRASGLIPSRRQESHPKQCAGCGGIMERGKHEAIGRWGKRRFCAPACMYTYRRNNPESMYRYIGHRIAYYGPNWPEQARLARERDRHTCRDCGTVHSSRALDVHHIVPRRAFGGDYLQANRLDNLISLCRSCHTTREADAVRRGEVTDRGWWVPTRRDIVMPTPTTRVCSKCGIEKPLDQYSRHQRGYAGTRAECKACSALRESARQRTPRSHRGGRDEH